MSQSQSHWYTQEHDISSGQKGLKSWAKEENGRVMTSEGLTVDFAGGNFMAKHLKIVQDSTSYNSLLDAGRVRQVARKSGAIPGVAASTSTILVMTVGQLAAWGADIAKQKKAIGNANSSHNGTPQWEITSDLKSVAFLTHKHNVGSPLTSGIGAYVMVTCVMPNANTITVVHFNAAHTGLIAKNGQTRTIDTPANQNVMTNSIINAKREERFNRGIKADDDVLDLSSLFGS